MLNAQFSNAIPYFELDISYSTRTIELRAELFTSLIACNCFYHNQVNTLYAHFNLLILQCSILKLALLLRSCDGCIETKRYEGTSSRVQGGGFGCGSASDIPGQKLSNDN